MNTLEDRKCILRGVLNRNVLEQLNAEDSLVLEKVLEICLNHEKSIEIIQGDIGNCILKGVLNPIISKELIEECPLTIGKAITICENIPTEIGECILSGVFNETILKHLLAENSLTVKKAFKICQTYEEVLKSDSTNPVIGIPRKYRSLIFSYVLHETVLDKLLMENSLTTMKVLDICHEYEKTLEEDLFNLGNCILKGVFNPSVLRELCDIQLLTINTAYIICNDYIEDSENTPIDVIDCISKAILHPKVLSQLYNEQSLTITKAYEICQPCKKTQCQQEIKHSRMVDNERDVEDKQGNDEQTNVDLKPWEDPAQQITFIDIDSENEDIENSAEEKGKVKTNDISSEGETNDIFFEGETNDISFEGETNNISSEGETNDISFEGETNDISFEGETNDISFEGETNDISFEGETNNISSEGETNDISFEGETNDISFEGETNNISSEGETNDISFEGETNDISSEGETNDISFEGETNDIYFEGETKKIYFEGELFNIYSNDKISDLRKRAKHAFGLMMRAHFGRTDGIKFQPCADDISILEIDPGLLQMLREGTLVDFLYIMFPIYPVSLKIEANIFDEAIKGNDSIFSVHNHNQPNISEFLDLTKRANMLVDIIYQNNRVMGDNSIKIHLLDGHGRMLLCIIKAAMDKGFNPNDILKIKLFEINEDAHRYHKFALPECVEAIGKSIIDYRNYPPSPNSIIYLNFCSIPSTNSFKWKEYFSNQNIENWVPACCKENVLKYIWKTISPPLSCTVMVSLIIKHQQNSAKDNKNGSLYQKFQVNLGHSINGLGFIYLLRDKDIFDTEIVSIRPEDGIIWYDTEKRKPMNVKSGAMGHPFITLLVRPNTRINLASKDLLKSFAKSLTKFDVFYLEEYLSDLTIADMCEDVFQVGSLVKITSGKNKGKSGIITERSAAKLKLDDTNFVHISSCRPI